MNDPSGREIASDRVQGLAFCFRAGVRFAALGDAVRPVGAVNVVSIPAHEHEPEGLSAEVLPLLAVPEGDVARNGEDLCKVLVAVEGRDVRMADAISALLDPVRAGIALIHVTWIPGIAGAPIGESGLDNPSPTDLLAFEGAREALIGTAEDLTAAGFNVSTHLREDRDPAVALAGFIERHNPDLFVLGLGRHGAGIGRRLLERVRLPLLYVRAR
jgi:hypothetical protein